MPPVVREAQQSKPTDAGAAEPPPEGISQFIAKILDQLNVSSWLPGTMFVGNAALLLQLYRQGNVDIAAAAVALTSSPLGVLIVIFFGVVLAAMVAQAFAFEVIRLLEGYWGGTRVSTRLLAWRTARHLSKFLRLDERIRNQTRRAFCEVARPEMLAQHVARSTCTKRECSTGPTTSSDTRSRCGRTRTPRPGASSAHRRCCGASKRPRRDSASIPSSTGYCRPGSGTPCGLPKHSSVVSHAATWKA